MIHLRPMTTVDLPLGLHLSRQAGWNQLPADWQRLLNCQPDGCFVAEWHGTPAGTIVTGIFGPVAWIAMVLVEETLRGRSIGKALMRFALEFLDRRGVATVRLDATPLGQPLYEQLGFVAQFRLTRYEGTLPSADAVAGVEAALPEQWQALAALDETVTYTNRREVLWRLLAEQPQAVRCVQQGNRIAGYLTSRPGARAQYVGPCITNAAAGPLLLADAWHRHAGQHIFMDIPEPNEPATRLAEAQGLTVQRRLLRMCRGVNVCERVEWLWASAGPEKG
jgi:GNAT superfamily N-acetyltransferase